MPKRKFNTYNDGVVSIYREKPRATDFNAKRNAKSLDDMDFLLRLDYEESSRREEDMEFAKKNGFSLSLKIRTRAVPGVDKQSNCMAVIDGYLYSVQYADKNREEMWLYLEQVRRLEGVRNLAT